MLLLLMMLLITMMMMVCQDMLKALECRYDAVEDKLSSGPRQPPVCTMADSEFDVASSSTSFADSGRGLSCEVHDETAVKALNAASRDPELPGQTSDASGRRNLELRPSEPAGRTMETFGRGVEPLGKRVEGLGYGLEGPGRRGNTVVTVEDTLMAQTAALDACRQMQLPSLRSAVNVVGNTGTHPSDWLHAASEILVHCSIQ